MAREISKWAVFIAITWIQAFAGTNLDFSAYSTELKSVLAVSQLQLNCIGVASDLGKVFGWCSGIALLHFRTWVVMSVAAFMGFTGYGFQWLAIRQIINLPYFLVLVLSLLAGCSICWFNTVSYVLCIKCFQGNRGLALSLSMSYGGLSAAMYNILANSIDPNDSRLYLLLNAIVPLITSIAALPAIVHHSPSEDSPPSDPECESSIFRFLTAVAIITGLHLLLLNSKSAKASIARPILAGAIFLLIFPLLALGVVYLWEYAPEVIRSGFQQHSSPISLISRDGDGDGDDVHRELTEGKASSFKDANTSNFDDNLTEQHFHYNDGRKVELGEDHSTFLLIHRFEFWLYYAAYFCGGTIGLVYGNNLGQISESLGYHADTNSLVALYSASSFFGRLLSMMPDFLREKLFYARTIWLAVAIVPTPVAFLLLVSSASKATLVAATAFIGLSSGFVSAAAVSITSELFGPNRAGVNHNILITNIPFGSLLFSLLASLVYEANIGSSNKAVTTVCSGKNCFHKTFICWWIISLLGLVSSVFLSFRTKGTYDRLEKQKHKPKLIMLRSISK